MKTFLLTLLAVFAAASALGQDLIMKRDGEKIEAKVLEITDTHVRFHYSSHLDGPAYNLSLADVRQIEYANGARDVIEMVAIQAPIDMQTLGGPLSIRKNSVYMVGDTRLTRNQILQFTAPYEDVVKQIRTGYKQKRAAIILGSIGGGLLAYGCFLSIVYGEAYGGPLGCMVVGAVAGATSVGLGLASLNSQKRAMQLYNDATGYSALPQRDVTLSLAPTHGGLGLQLNF